MDNSSLNGHAQNVQSGGDPRRLMLKKIYDYLMLKKQGSSYLPAKERMFTITRVLEKALFDAASSLDEYMNADTFENRLISHFRQLRTIRDQRLVEQLNSGLANLNLNLDQNKEFVQHGNSFGNSSTMIPTSGGISQLTSGMGSANGDQQVAASVFPTTSGSSNMGSSMDGGEGTSSQMMQVKEEN